MDPDLKISSGPIFCHRCGTLMINTGDDVLECLACNAKKDAAGNLKKKNFFFFWIIISNIISPI